MNRKQAPGVIAAVFAVCVCGWLTLQSSHDSSTSEKRAIRLGFRDWKTHLVERGQAQLGAGQGHELAALTSLHGEPEGMPFPMRQRIRENLGGIKPLHLRFGQAQRVRAFETYLWIVDGAAVTCIFSEGMPASSCGTSADAMSEGIWLETYKTRSAQPGRPTSFHAFGAVPSEVHGVAVTIGGRRSVIPVQNHAWTRRARIPIKVQGLVRGSSASSDPSS